jgi:hypothetical protein
MLCEGFNLSEIINELIESTSLKWPVSFDLKVQYIMLTTFKCSKYVGYCPSVNVKPDKQIVEYAHKVQEYVRRKIKGDYIPDLLGFYRCRVHYGDEAPSGIYLFANKIREAAKTYKIGADSLVVAVFYHEFAHLLAHTIALHKPADVSNVRNFEEPFCELYAYYATFVPELPKENVKILGRDVELRSRYVWSIEQYDLMGFSESDKDLFRTLSRPFPYKWFNCFMDIAQKVLGSEELALTLAEKALDGTLLMYALGQLSCDRSSIFLIDAEPLREYPQEEVKTEFSALYIASAINP